MKRKTTKDHDDGAAGDDVRAMLVSLLYALRSFYHICKRNTVGNHARPANHLVMSAAHSLIFST